MANYLVTGAAGFIGSRVASLLLARGDSVTGIDNLNSAYDVRMKEWRLDQLQQQPNFRFLKADVCDRAALEQGVPADTRYAAIINLAARAGVRQSVVDPWAYVDTNTAGTLNLLELARERRIPKFLLASTSSLYGNSNGGPCNEVSDTSRPLSPYAASKKAAEAMCYSYHHLHGIDVTVFRYFTVYGPCGRPDMSAFRFVQWISEGRPVQVYGDGSQSRDFTFVDDIARGTVAGLKPVGYGTFNLGSDHPVALMDVIHMVEDLTGHKAQLEFHPAHAADVRATWADIGCARKVLGWQPSTDICEGLSETAHWYRQNRQWAKDIDTTV